MNGMDRIPRIPASFHVRTICQATSLILVVCAAPTSSIAQAPTDWRLPRTHEHLLPDSVDCWEPALAVRPVGRCSSWRVDAQPQLDPETSIRSL
jgi:hypothetical protein